MCIVYYVSVVWCGIHSNYYIYKHHLEGMQNRFLKDLNKKFCRGGNIVNIPILEERRTLNNVYFYTKSLIIVLIHSKYFQN